MWLPIVPLAVDSIVATEDNHAVVFFIGMGLSHQAGANHILGLPQRCPSIPIFSKTKGKMYVYFAPESLPDIRQFFKETVYYFFEKQPSPRCKNPILPSLSLLPKCISICRIWLFPTDID